MLYRIIYFSKESELIGLPSCIICVSITSFIVMILDSQWAAFPFRLNSSRAVRRRILKNCYMLFSSVKHLVEESARSSLRAFAPQKWHLQRKFIFIYKNHEWYLQCELVYLQENTNMKKNSYDGQIQDINQRIINTMITGMLLYFRQQHMIQCNTFHVSQYPCLKGNSRVGFIYRQTIGCTGID